MNILPFRDLPKGAKRLIAYYSITVPGVVGFVIFNAYLFLLGYSPLYVGSIISGASIITALIIPVLGYLSDRKVNAKYYVMTTESLIGVSFLLYGFAQNAWWIFLGRVIFSAAMLFSFTSSIYEKELYPEEHLDDAYVWHWLIPSFAGIATYAAAFIYFSLFTSVEAVRIYYIIFGLMAPFYVLYVYLFLPDLPTYRKREKAKIKRELWLLISVFVLANLTLYFMYGISLDNILINHFGTGIAIVVLLALIDSSFQFASSIAKGNIPRRYFPKIPYLAMGGIGVIAMALFLAHMLAFESILLFILFYAFLAPLWPLWHMSFKPILVENVPKEYRGTVFSGAQSVLRIINIPMAFVVGSVITLFGSFAPLLVSSVLAFITIATLKMVGKGFSP